MIRKMSFFIWHTIISIVFCTQAIAAVDESAIKVMWGYKGNNGPSRWSELSSSFATCAQGKLQSPINIAKPLQKIASLLTLNYTDAPFSIIDDGTTELDLGASKVIVNDGHTIQLNFRPSKNQEEEKIIFNDHAYRLLQFHFHSPSETQLDGQSYPLEMHFVHQGDNHDSAVIAVFIKRGKANPELQKIIDHLPTAIGKEYVMAGAKIYPTNLMPENKSYYQFAGSLTTPPCTQGLQWIVMKNTITATSAQIFDLRKAVGAENARPVQPLNNRVISYYQEKK